MNKILTIGVILATVVGTTGAATLTTKQTSKVRASELNTSGKTISDKTAVSELTDNERLSASSFLNKKGKASSSSGGSTAPVTDAQLPDTVVKTTEGTYTMAGTYTVTGTLEVATQPLP